MGRRTSPLSGPSKGNWGGISRAQNPHDPQGDKDTSQGCHGVCVLCQATVVNTVFPRFPDGCPVLTSHGSCTLSVWGLQPRSTGALSRGGQEELPTPKKKRHPEACASCRQEQQPLYYPHLLPSPISLHTQQHPIYIVL